MDSRLPSASYASVVTWLRESVIVVNRPAESYAYAIVLSMRSTTPVCRPLPSNTARGRFLRRHTNPPLPLGVSVEKSALPAPYVPSGWRVNTEVLPSPPVMRILSPASCCMS